MRNACVHVLVVTLLLPASLALAQWTANGAAVCTDPMVQEAPVIASDGAGGAFVAWSDRRDDGFGDAYAQHIDGSGYALWAVNGIPVATGHGPQNPVGLLSDGSGGCFVVWQSGTSDSVDIFAQRLTTNGDATWSQGGVPLCTAPWNQYVVGVQSDNAGGLIVVWQDKRNGPTADMAFYAQRLAPDAEPLWQANGVVVCPTNGDPNYTVAAAAGDGAGGVYVAWSDYRNGGGSSAVDVYAQHIGDPGTPTWVASGLPVSTEANSQWLRRAVSDGAGGVILLWYDTRFSLSDHRIYAQRLAADGGKTWGAGGVAISDDPSEDLALSADGNAGGGVVLAWCDTRNGGSLFAQRISTDGAMMWSTGVALGRIPYGTPYVTVLDASDGGAMVAWNHQVASTIVAQRLRSDGSLAWGSGVPLFDYSLGVLPFGIASDGADGCLVAAGFNGSLYDVYVPRVLWDGLSRAPLVSTSARIEAVVDTPNDGGGSVDLHLSAAPSDASGDSVVTGYSVWRRSSDTGSPPPGFLAGSWDSIAYVAVAHSTSYVIPAPTLADSSAGGSGDEAFVVKTLTKTAGVYTVTASASGHSVNNSIVSVSGLQPVLRALLRAVRTVNRGHVKIEIALPTHDRAVLDLCDMRGRLVARLLDRTVSPGVIVTSTWDGLAHGLACAGGVYVVRLVVHGRTLATERVVLVHE